MEVVTSTEHI